MSDAKEDIVRRLANLRQAFIEGLPGRFDELEGAFDSICRVVCADDVALGLETIQGVSHKLRGAAGTFGLDHISLQAEKIETRCAVLLSRKAPPLDEELDGLKVLLSELKNASQAVDNAALVEEVVWATRLGNSAAEGRTLKPILLVDDDESFCESLKTQVAPFGYDFHWISDISNLDEAIKKYQPSAILMDIIFPGDEDAGIGAIKEIKKKGDIGCPVIFISQRDELEARLKAIRAGCSGYLVKPVDISLLVETLNHLTRKFSDDPYRILVVDDDEETVKRNSLILEGAGMKTAAVTQSTRAVDEVRRMKPDAILMDISMPDCDGFELAAAIRQDVAFVNIPIIFLTALDKARHHAAALNSGSDDFIEKTATPEFIIATVEARARRFRELSALMKRLKESETRFKSMAQSASEAIISIDRDGNIVFWNEGASRIFGYDGVEILGRPISLLIPERYQKSHGEVFSQVLREGGSANFGRLVELKGRARNGREFPVELSLSDWNMDGDKFFTAILRDITFSKEAERALRKNKEDLEKRVEVRTQELIESEKKFSGIVEIAPEAVVSIGEDFKIRLFNQGAENVFGYGPQEVIGKPLEMLLPKRFRGQHQNHMMGFAGSDENSRLMSRRGEVIGLRKDGREFPAEASISKLQSVDGIIMTVMMVDISSRKKTEEHLRQSQKLEAIGNLTSGVAHEFNNMLMGVLGNLEILSEDVQISEKGQALLHAAIGSVLRGKELTGHLLSYARKDSLNPRPVLPNEIVLKASRLIASTVEESYEIKTMVLDDAGQIFIDPGELEGALLNLAINARDAMPDGGRILIETKNVYLDEAFVLPVPELSKGDYVRISVTDTGVGMPPEIIEQVFDPFFTTKDVGKGTGLGLSMVYGFIKQSKGHIEIKSAPGKGTMVALYLPRNGKKEDLGEEPSTVQVVERVRGGDETILVVEDDVMVMTVALEMLSGMGYRVLTASNGANALDILQKGENIDLMLTDVVMPGGMTGVKLATKAKILKPGLKILLATGYSPENIFKDLGSSYPVLIKPYRKGELAREVRALLDSGEES